MQQTLEPLITSAWLDAWDKGDLSALDRLMAEGYTRTSKATGATVDLAGLKSEIEAVREAFPDLRTTVDDVVEGEGTVAVFWTSTGTHTHEYLGVPATGLTVQTRGSNILVLQDGKILKETVTWDGSELLAGLGIRPLRGIATPEVPESADSAELELDLMKAFNRQFITGVTVITTKDGDKPKGLAANAYCSVSLEPPLVLVCVQKTSSTYPALFSSSHLGINILGTEQRETVRVFASKSTDKFAEIDWHEGPKGSPLLDGSPASLEAEIQERFQAKTHTVFICRVRHAEIDESAPIVYKAGHFFDGGNLAEL
ncbi:MULTISPECIES: flavin reductase [Arthrobacter]|uniref:Flavin reductase n=1 Tax=Arthrobacter terricola TaxID=2547396 RepID=A0A4R5KS65_9MICC|nr:MULTISPECIES: flavin reductase [Arthrobacter]MBT8160717.1 flavin reductase [Arthrobacter sp. GN70]TDF97868.1 flavin reductase [Arthrobacter terricola]